MNYQKLLDPLLKHHQVPVGWCKPLGCCSFRLTTTTLLYFSVVWVEILPTLSTFLWRYISGIFQPLLTCTQQRNPNANDKKDHLISSLTNNYWHAWWICMYIVLTWYIIFSIFTPFFRYIVLTWYIIFSIFTIFGYIVLTWYIIFSIFTPFSRYIVLTCSLALGSVVFCILLITCRWSRVIRRWKIYKNVQINKMGIVEGTLQYK